MSCTFYSAEFGTVQLQPGLPPGFKGPFLSGSSASFFSHTSGSIIMQELQYDFGSLHYVLFDFLQKIQLKTNCLRGLQALLVHEGELILQLAQYGRLRFKTHQFALSNLKTVESKLQLTSKRTGMLLVGVNELLAKQLGDALPKMKPFLTGEDKRIEIHSAHPKLAEAVHEILHAEWEPAGLPFYFKNKIGEYLFLLLHQIAKNELKKLVPSSWEMKAVNRVRDIILTDILKHYSITELAKKEKINEFRLKVFFKREYGVGPYEFLLNARLAKAKELIEQGMPMKQAAPLAGYRTTSFITAFKRKYGYSPGAIQRKK